MKFITLHSTSDDGSFDVDFNEDLMLKPRSQLALNTLSIKRDPQFLIVDANNSQITIRFSTTDGDRIADIPFDNYDDTNINTLLKAIQHALNICLDLTPTNIGIQWKVSTSSDRVNIQFNTAKFIQPNIANNELVHRNASQTGTNKQVLNRSVGAGTLGTLDSWVLSQTKFGQGCSSLKARVYRLGDNTAGHDVYFGLTKRSSINVSETLSINDFFCAIILKVDTQEYSYYLNGTRVDTADNIRIVATNNAGNDFFTIDYSLGRLQLLVYDNSLASSTNLGSVAYDFDDGDLYPLIAFAGNEDNRIDTFKFTPDPYASSISSADADDEDGLGANKPPSQSNLGNDLKLEFDADSLSSFLGYSKQLYQPTGTSQSYNYVAEQKLEISYIPQNIEVYMDSIELDSYNSRVSKRDNILAIVPNEKNEKLNFNYQVRYPIFINVKNEFEEYFRNIRVRLRDEDGSPLATSGSHSISLLVKDEDDLTK
jgi:hypothetical protein